MKLRSNSQTFVNGRKTDRDCHLCEEGTVYKDGHELVCGSCYYTPSTDEDMTTVEEPQIGFRRALDARVDGEIDDRPRMPGGWHDAYWGDGEYEFSPEEGFQNPF